MNSSIQIIPLSHLAIALIPVLIVMAIYSAWSLKTTRIGYALARMVAQLLLVGYLLAYLFEAANSIAVVLVLMVMVFASCWIALGNIPAMRFAIFKQGLAAIALAGGLVLWLVTGPVLNTEPWYEPRTIIPLAGMIFSAAMNSISLAGERLFAELKQSENYPRARNAAFRASLIPVVNSFFAVGIVSLPGMMTGQILSGVSPLIAARYQIVVMCMVLGASGIAAACFLQWIRPIALNATGSNKDNDR